MSAADSPLDNTPREANLDDFQRLKQIGSGGFGTVYDAIAGRDLEYGRAGDHFAIKVYHPGVLDGQTARDRVEREFKTGLNLRHQNLVRFFQLSLSGPKPFLVMELCDGDNLFQWRQKNRQPTGDFILQFATEMLEVLEFLHSSGRIHRDLKPTNINVDSDGRIRLMDYGLVLDVNAPALTSPGSDKFLGTYKYAAPETIFERDHDKRYSFKSDLYSLGATLYYLLYGVQVFDSVKQMSDVLEAKRQHNISFSQRFSDSVLNSVHDLCQRLLAPKVDERPPNAASCWELLAKSMPSTMPFRVYFACALTHSAKRQYLTDAARVVKRVGEAQRYKVYVPGEHTDPVGMPGVSPTEVYWIDRERVASSDLVILMADHPSFGVGQEAEIAANSGVPLAIFHSPEVQVSRMLRGLPGNLMVTDQFADLTELERLVERFFRQNRERLTLSRETREREFHLRVGNRVRDLRRQAGLSFETLAAKAGVNAELVKSLESRPEQQSNFSLVNLRKIARALDVPSAELLRDQSTLEEEFATLSRASIANLRTFAKNERLSYEIYEKLKEIGLKQVRDRYYGLAWQGGKKNATTPWGNDQWRDLLISDLRRERVSSEATTETQPGLFADDSFS